MQEDTATCRCWGVTVHSQTEQEVPFVKSLFQLEKRDGVGGALFTTLVVFEEREIKEKNCQTIQISLFVLVTFPVALRVWPAPNSSIVVYKS